MIRYNAYEPTSRRLVSDFCIVLTLFAFVAIYVAAMRACHRQPEFTDQEQAQQDSIRREEFREWLLIINAQP